MSERLKESVLKTEVFIGIPGVLSENRYRGGWCYEMAIYRIEE